MDIQGIKDYSLEYEVLRKVVRRDCTSVVGVIVANRGEVYFVPRVDYPKVKFSNAFLSKNGKMFLKKEVVPRRKYDWKIYINEIDQYDFSSTEAFLKSVSRR